ncbi:B-cell receptor-associated 31-like protein [Choiromyces venosus 120613-1]|uniref:Endoplasmic reticulum transmembrane protein n=1 Tax=Choiromyces venosus 120613-1 TaxID=1336337 RepID=A0A3N4JG83_9PEZI|nr:B-cell receptor-associated 31-like protein [Choiromyces venosus 120613-1]
MTLYYSLVFVLLMVEMAAYFLMVLPVPYSPRMRFFTWISTSSVVGRIQYCLKITFVFILILFIDSVNRVYRVQSELSENKHMGGQSVMGHERMEVQARKFYSQRNMYLCGFTLFLSFILDRTYSLTLENLQLHTTVKQLRADNAEGGVEELKEQLAAAKRDVEVMKKQAEGLTREFDSLADRYAEVSSGETIPKKEL